MPQAAIFGEMGENRAGPHQTGQESPRSYMERTAKSREGFAGPSAGSWNWRVILCELIPGGLP